MSLDINTVDVARTFGDIADVVSAGADAGANIANYLRDIISPDSRRAQSNPVYGGNPGGYPGYGQQMGQPQQMMRRPVPYGYAEPGSGYNQYQTGAMTEEGISDPSYGKGVGFR